MHGGIARNRAVDPQHATVDISVAGVGVSSREDERSRPDLRQRAAYPATSATVLNYAGKGGAQVVGADGQVIAS